MKLRPLELGQAPERYDRSWWQQAIGRMETWARTLFTAKAYTVTNLTESRSFDADTVTTAQLADVVGTLIEDLKNGRLPQ